MWLFQNLSFGTTTQFKKKNITFYYNTAILNIVKGKLCHLAYVSFMGFKENLKSELAYQNMLVKELASLSGVSKHTLDNYLNVRGYMPSADVAVKIARALGVSVEYLVTGKENHPNESSPGSEIRVLIQNFKLLKADDRKMIIAIMQLYRKHRENN